MYTTDTRKTTKSALPPTGVVDIDFDEQTYMHLSIKDPIAVIMDVYMHLPNGLRAKLSLKVARSYPPGAKTLSSLSRNNDTGYDWSSATGYARTYGMIVNALFKKAWHLEGITNDQWQTPFCIIVLPGVMATCSLKKRDEDINHFNP